MSRTTLMDTGRFLQIAAIAFGLAYTVHALDHARRGFDSAPTRVFVIGTVQGLFAVLAVWLVLRGHKSGPALAVAVGFGSALLFTSGHLLPFSPDSYVSHADDTVTWFSWVTAFGEIGTGTIFGLAAISALLDRRSAAGTPATS